MKPEEALKIIDGVEEMRGTFPEDGLLVEEALILAKDALKKQVPEAPIEGYVFSDAFREHLKESAPEIAETKGSCCPRCEKNVGEDEVILKRKNYPAFCKWCGQALKQEETDD